MRIRSLERTLSSRPSVRRILKRNRATPRLDSHPRASLPSGRRVLTL
jgi:hypothetical protein